jgi:hypothetical protein
LDHIRDFVELGAMFMIVLACGFLVVALVRRYKVPECLSCGAMKVRQSRPSGFFDRLFSLLLIVPYRCNGCRERFYAVRQFGGFFFQASGPRARGKRLVKVAFRFRHGVPNRVSIRVVNLASANRKPGPISGSPAMFQT